MLNLIKSYIAHRNWIKAHELMANQSPDLALIAVRRAINIESDKTKLSEYLELQKNIELAIGRKPNSREMGSKP